MDSEIALPGKGSPEITGIALIRAPKMAVGNYPPDGYPDEGFCSLNWGAGL